MNGFIKTVAAMTDEDLCALSGDLRLRYSENDVSGEMLGIVLVEQAERFSEKVRGTAEAQRSQRDAEQTHGNGEGFL